MVLKIVGRILSDVENNTITIRKLITFAILYELCFNFPNVFAQKNIPLPPQITWNMRCFIDCIIAYLFMDNKNPDTASQ